MGPTSGSGRVSRGAFEQSGIARTVGINALPQSQCECSWATRYLATLRLHLVSQPERPPIYLMIRLKNSGSGKLLCDRLSPFKEVVSAHALTSFALVLGE